MYPLLAAGRMAFLMSPFSVFALEKCAGHSIGVTVTLSLQQDYQCDQDVKEGTEGGT